VLYILFFAVSLNYKFDVRFYFLQYLQLPLIRYLGVVMKRSRVFKCSIDYAKRVFYRAANAIFGKIGRIASEEVISQLIV